MQNFGKRDFFGEFKQEVVVAVIQSFWCRGLWLAVLNFQVSVKCKNPTSSLFLFFKGEMKVPKKSDFKLTFFPLVLIFTLKNLENRYRIVCVLPEPGRFEHFRYNFCRIKLI